MIITAEHAAALVLDAYGTGFDHRVFHVVDLGPGWRVFNGGRGRLENGDLIGPHMINPFPMYVDHSSGELTLERSPRIPGPSAQDAYRTMFQQQIGPGLRQLGLRGSGMRYHLPVPDHFSTVTFRVARRSTWAVAHLLGQVSVIPHTVWQAKVAEGRVRGDKPSNSHFDPDREPRLPPRVDGLRRYTDAAGSDRRDRRCP